MREDASSTWQGAVPGFVAVDGVAMSNTLATLVYYITVHNGDRQYRCGHRYRDFRALYAKLPGSDANRIEHFPPKFFIRSPSRQQLADRFLWLCAFVATLCGCWSELQSATRKLLLEFLAPDETFASEVHAGAAAPHPGAGAGAFARLVTAAAAEDSSIGKSTTHEMLMKRLSLNICVEVDKNSGSAPCSSSDSCFGGLPSVRRTPPATYIIWVITAQHSLVVNRRYSQFRQLFLSLPANLRNKLESIFPRRTFTCCFGVSEDVVSARRELLERFLHILVNHGALFYLDTFLDEDDGSHPHLDEVRGDSFCVPVAWSGDKLAKRQQQRSRQQRRSAAVNKTHNSS